MPIVLPLSGVPNLEFYGAMLALIKGAALSAALTEERETPDSELYKHIAQTGLADDAVYAHIMRAD